MPAVGERPNQRVDALLLAETADEQKYSLICGDVEATSQGGDALLVHLRGNRAVSIPVAMTSMGDVVPQRRR